MQEELKAAVHAAALEWAGVAGLAKEDGELEHGTLVEVQVSCRRSMARCTKCMGKPRGSSTTRLHDTKAGRANAKMEAGHYSTCHTWSGL